MYSVYSLSTGDLLRVVETLEYDSMSEGYVLMADSYAGDVVWNRHVRNYIIPDDPYYIIPAIDFVLRFTLSERLAIHQAAATGSYVLTDMLFQLHMVTHVDLKSDNTVACLNYMTSIGILTPTRLHEIRGY
jgi:hypothetical protein